MEQQKDDQAQSLTHRPLAELIRTLQGGSLTQPRNSMPPTTTQRQRRKHESNLETSTETARAQSAAEAEPQTPPEVPRDPMHADPRSFDSMSSGRYGNKVLEVAAVTAGVAVIVGSISFLAATCVGWYNFAKTGQFRKL